MSRRESADFGFGDEPPPSVVFHNTDDFGCYDNMAEIKDFIPASDGTFRVDEDVAPDMRSESFGGFVDDDEEKEEQDHIDDEDDDDDDAPPLQPPRQYTDDNELPALPPRPIPNDIAMNDKEPTDELLNSLAKEWQPGIDDYDVDHLPSGLNRQDSIDDNVLMNPPTVESVPQRMRSMQLEIATTDEEEIDVDAFLFSTEETYEAPESMSQLKNLKPAEKPTTTPRRRSATSASVRPDLAIQNWFFGDRDKAICVDLVEGGTEGTFAVRNNSSKSGFVMMVNESGTVVNYQATKTPGVGVRFAGQVHASMYDVVLKAIKNVFKGVSGRPISLLSVAKGGAAFIAIEHQLTMFDGANTRESKRRDEQSAVEAKTMTLKANRSAASDLSKFSTLPPRMRSSTTALTTKKVDNPLPKKPPREVEGWILPGTKSPVVDVYISYCGKDLVFGREFSTKVHQDGMGRIHTFFDDVSLMAFKADKNDADISGPPKFTPQARNQRYTAVQNSSLITIIVSSQGIQQFLKRPNRFNNFIEECEWALEGGRTVVPVFLKAELRSGVKKELKIGAIFSEIEKAGTGGDEITFKRFKETMLKLEQLPDKLDWERNSAFDAAQVILKMLAQKREGFNKTKQRKDPQDVIDEVLLEREFRIKFEGKKSTKIFYLKLKGNPNGSKNGTIELFDSGATSTRRGDNAPISTKPERVVQLKHCVDLDYSTIPGKGIDCIAITLSERTKGDVEVIMIAASQVQTLAPWMDEIRNQCGKLTKRARHSLNKSFKIASTSSTVEEELPPTPRPSVTLIEGFNEESDIDEPDIWGSWRIERANVDIEAKIGSGEYGEVFSGILRGTGTNAGKAANVAIKSLKKNNVTQDFLKEAEVMIELRHENLVNFYGVVDRGDPMYLVCELCSNGSLKDYLKVKGNVLQLPATLKMSAEIAYGMEHLESLGFVHRDLALRNILLDDMVAKVSDFGLARCVEEGIYQAKADALCAIRWTAPEAMNEGIFSSKSDVWSFGVTLYELMTGGSDPYPGLTNVAVIRLVDNGGHLEKPNSIPDVVFDVMIETWNKDENDRPSFSSLSETFTDLSTSVDNFRY